jgi:hypothetical protein
MRRRSASGSSDSRFLSRRRDARAQSRNIGKRKNARLDRVQLNAYLGRLRRIERFPKSKLATLEDAKPRWRVDKDFTAMQLWNLRQQGAALFRRRDAFDRIADRSQVVLSGHLQKK